jgi:hypothetical protein
VNPPIEPRKPSRRGRASFRVFVWGNLLAAGMVVGGIALLVRAMGLSLSPDFDGEEILSKLAIVLIYSGEVGRDAIPGYSVILGGIALGLLSNVTSLGLGAWAWLAAPRDEEVPRFAILGMLSSGVFLVMALAGIMWLFPRLWF